METIRNTDKSLGALSWASDSAPDYCEEISGLYSWSSNYPDMKPFRKFLDLVGYSAEHYGVALANWSAPSEALGYLELGKLGRAISEWADRPTDSEVWVSELLLVESEFGL